MNHKLIPTMLLTFGLPFMITAQPPTLSIPPYPITKQVDQADDYFGTKVSDPYRWLEDDNSPETAEWVAAQNKATESYLSQIPYRNALKERLTEVWNYEKMSNPVRQGGKLYYFANSGLQNQEVIVERSEKGGVVVLLDPNKEFPDGTVSVTGFEVSNDGKYLAYSISRSGSDWTEIYVIDLKKKKRLDDEIRWVKFSAIAWKGKGFYYSRYPEPEKGREKTVTNERHKIYYHKIGTKQAKDELIFENPDFPQRSCQAQITEDERFLVISESESTSGNALYCIDLRKDEKKVIRLFKDLTFDKEVIGNFTDTLLIRTNMGADKYKLIAFPQSHFGTEETLDLISEERDMVLESASLANGMIVARYMHRATNLVQIFDPRGQMVNKIMLPDIGTVGSIHTRQDDPEIFYSFTSFTYPTSIYRYNVRTQEEKLIFQPSLPFNMTDYETRQVFYSSFDQTQVPMFIVTRKGTVLDGSNPTLLYGYGGFNVSLTPTFSVSRMVFLENGGILAVANIRGGGEFGREWHQAGTKEKKQTVFNDFIAAARFLIKNGYTNSQKLAIQGGSNGGLLVGACMTQEPDLFRVALPAVGVMDMLRYHKFTIGWAWKTDYGSSEDEEGFAYLYKYSPLHNLKKGVNYPATFVTTADHDDRVVPAHSFKFIASLQEKNKGSNPQLIRIQTKAGHGAGKSTSVRIEEAADTWAFTFANLGMDMKVMPNKKPGEMDIKKQRKPGFLKDPKVQQAMPQRPPKGDPAQEKLPSR